MRAWQYTEANAIAQRAEYKLRIALSRERTYAIIVYGYTERSGIRSALIKDMPRITSGVGKIKINKNVELI